MLREECKHYAVMLGIESGYYAVACRGKRQALCCDVGNRERVLCCGVEGRGRHYAVMLRIERGYYAVV
jgi:hypothetical protein